MTADSRRATLVHDWLTGMRGGENVLEEIGGLLPEAPIHTLLHWPGSVSEAIERHPIHTSFVQRLPFARRHYRSYLPLFPAAIESLDLREFDLVVSTSHCVAKGVVPSPDAYHLCYCFTPMRYAWDQEPIYFPNRTGPVARLRSLALSRLRVWDAASAPRVDRFVTISRFVARRIRRYYGREADIVYPPVDVDYFSPGGERPDRPFAVSVAALVPYKRVDLAIEACAAAGIDLVVVGDGPDRRRLERLGSSGTRFVGRVEREELRNLYRGASLLVQPGLEDFGISSVEALACGTPVVGLGEGGLVDIADDGRHGQFTKTPGDVAELTATIDKTIQTRFNEDDLVRRAREFSVQRFRRRLGELLSHSPEGSVRP